MNFLELKHLRLICMIHQTQNLTRAAENLCVTQSALSQQLKELETRIGADLFHRTGKKMVITRVGKALVNKAVSIMDQVADAELDIGRMVKGEKGKLRIGVRCLFCYMWLPGVLKRFQEKYPQVDLEIRNALDPEQDLLSQGLDLAISAQDRWDPRIESTPLFEDEVVVVMSRDDPNRAKPFMEPKDFNGADIISMVDRSRHYFYETLDQHPGIIPRRYMVISHPEAMVSLIDAGLGLGILPRWFVTPYAGTKDLVFCPLTAKGTRLVWKASWLGKTKVPVYLLDLIRLMSAQDLVASRSRGNG